MRPRQKQTMSSFSKGTKGFVFFFFKKLSREIRKIKGKAHAAGDQMFLQQEGSWSSLPTPHIYFFSPLICNRPYKFESVFYCHGCFILMRIQSTLLRTTKERNNIRHTHTHKSQGLWRDRGQVVRSPCCRRNVFHLSKDRWRRQPASSQQQQQKQKKSQGSIVVVPLFWTCQRAHITWCWV